MQDHSSYSSPQRRPLRRRCRQWSSGGAKLNRHTFSSGPTSSRIDLTEHRAWWSGQLLDLTEYELKLLACLAEDPQRAWRFSELLSKVWSVDAHGHPDVVHAVVRHLRNKLSNAGTDFTVESVRGVGFRLAAPRVLNA
jgi:DNA-binding response OmpR family regulator